MNSSPCAKLTTSMIPKISVSPEATSARIMPVTTPLIVWISSWSSGISILRLLSDAGASFPQKREPGAACCGGCRWAHAYAGATVSRIGALHAYVLMDNPIVGAQLGGWGVVTDHAFFQDV